LLVGSKAGQVVGLLVGKVAGLHGRTPVGGTPS
jgi:hypothetical protein